MRNATVLKLVACGCKSRLGSQVPRHRPMTRKRLLCYFREWQLPGPVNPGVQGWRYTLDKVRQTAGESPAPAARMRTHVYTVKDDQRNHWRLEIEHRKNRWWYALVHEFARGEDQTYGIIEGCIPCEPELDQFEGYLLDKVLAAIQGTFAAICITMIRHGEYEVESR